MSRRASQRNFGKAVFSQKVVPDSDADEYEESVASAETSGDEFQGEDSDSKDMNVEEDIAEHASALTTSQSNGHAIKKRRVEVIKDEGPAPAQTPLSKIAQSESLQPSARSSARSSKASSESGFDSIGAEMTPATSVASSRKLTPATMNKSRGKKAWDPPSTMEMAGKAKGQNESSKVEDQDEVEDLDDEDDDMKSEGDSASNFSSGLSAVPSDLSDASYAVKDASESSSEDRDASYRIVPSASRRKASAAAEDPRLDGMTGRVSKQLSMSYENKEDQKHQHEISTTLKKRKKEKISRKQPNLH